MGTGARTPKPDAYPGRLAAELAIQRACGVKSFEMAWKRAIQHLGVPPDWDHAYPEQPDETPLAFAKRHFAAAWANRVPQRYCQVEGCFRRTEKRYCAKHRVKQRLAAAA